MESVTFHELLHVVRIDVPQDDGLIDYLVFSESKLDLLPDRIYQSTDGRHPLNVTSSNITSIDFVSSSHIQVNTTCIHNVCYFNMTPSAHSWLIGHWNVYAKQNVISKHCLCNIYYFLFSKIWIHLSIRLGGIGW